MKLKGLSIAIVACMIISCIFTTFPHTAKAAQSTNALSFAADNSGIEVGQSDEVTFSAVLDTSGVSGLCVTDESGNTVARLHETSSGRYEATVTLTATEKGDCTYTLNTANADEFTCDMHFYTPLTKEDEAKDAATWARVSDISATLTENNKTAVVNALYNSLKKDANVADIWFETETTLNYRTQDGVMHVYDADYTLVRRGYNLDGVAEENAKPSEDDEPETRGAIGNRDIYVVAPDYGLDSNFTEQKLLEARNAQYAMGGGTISAYYGNGSLNWPEVKGKGDVGAFKKISGNGMVIIDSHGVQVNNKSAIVVTYSSGDSSADYSAGRLVRGHDDLGDFIAVMDTFISYYNNSLPHSIVYIGSCFGVWASNLRNAFSNLGAAVVAGYDWSVSFFWEQRVYGQFMKSLYKPNSDGSINTCQQAFNKVKELFGDTDSVGEKKAKFRLYGDTSTTLLMAGQTEPSPSPTAPVGNITVSLTPEKLTLNVGDTQKLQLTIEPAEIADSCEIDWSSFNEEIATVTNTGVVRALGTGKTRIAVEVTAPGGEPIAKSIELTVVADGYKVTFIDGLTGKVIDEQIVPEGEAAIEPTPPKHDGYVFIGWDEDFDDVTEDIVVRALYALLGDANLDDKINTLDATYVLKYSAKMISLSSKQLKAADMSGDGKVNTADATAILKYVSAH